MNHTSTAKFLDDPHYMIWWHSEYWMSNAWIKFPPPASVSKSGTVTIDAKAAAEFPIDAIYLRDESVHEVWTPETGWVQYRDHDSAWLAAERAADALPVYDPEEDRKEWVGLSQRSGALAWAKGTSKAAREAMAILGNLETGYGTRHGPLVPGGCLGYSKANATR